MKGGEVFFTVTAKQFYVAKGLRAFAFNSKAAIAILDVVGCGYNIVCDFEKFGVVAAVRAGQKICYLWV